MLSLDQESGQRQALFETIVAHREGGVLFAYIAAPPVNSLGPALVRDLVTLIQQTEADDSARVLVFRSADSHNFISHAGTTALYDAGPVTNTVEAEPPFSTLFRELAGSRLVTIAQIEGCVRGVGNEFALACDMRFASREFAIFGQPEAALGLVPGVGAVRHLTRLMGRGRALEVLIGAEDYDARAAEHYGWVNRSLPAAVLGDFVSSLAHRIAKFPPSSVEAIKQCANTLAKAENLGPDATKFLDCVSNSEAQHRAGTAIEPGFQSRAAEGDRMLRVMDIEV